MLFDGELGRRLIVPRRVGGHRVGALPVPGLDEVVDEEGGPVLSIELLAGVELPVLFGVGQQVAVVVPGSLAEALALVVLVPVDDQPNVFVEGTGLLPAKRLALEVLVPKVLQIVFGPFDLGGDDLCPIHRVDYLLFPLALPRLSLSADPVEHLFYAEGRPADVVEVLFLLL